MLSLFVLYGEEVSKGYGFDCDALSRALVLFCGVSCSELLVCILIPPNLISEASVSTILKASGLAKARQGSSLTFSLLTAFVCSSNQGIVLFFNLWKQKVLKGPEGFTSLSMIVENPFKGYMRILLAIVEYNDLEKHPRVLAEKYSRYDISPLNKPWIFYEHLLIETESVCVVHRHGNDNKNMIVFF
ncbi:hypothetical protein L3X38_010826 [Prunus dulcis]|uniref:Uncharacterized protein n=1 Tax=Prunus dulcis TaxID=3755 RepID=A0AAD4WG82_PRUDU|nr:hypothetical protein L3X38_010826 [Prunus dulcis]